MATHQVFWLQISKKWTEEERLILAAALKRWQNLLWRYSEEVKKDVAYWYNERANVSLLAAAVWTLGGVAIEEFTVNRRRSAVGSQDQRSSRQGRCDLWFQICNFLEAKTVWPNDSKDADAFKRILKRKLKEAKRQLKTLPEDEIKDAHGLLAVCFVVPEVNQTESPNGSINSFYNLASSALCQPSRKKSFENKYFVAAYEVTREGEETGKLSPPRYDDFYYPGVVLVGVLVEENNR